MKNGEKIESNGEKISLEEYRKAYRNIVIREEKRAVKTHFAIYVLVNAVMISANLVYSPKVLWFIYPLLGWGAGLIAHYLTSVRWIEKRLKKREEHALRHLCSIHP